MEFDWSNSFFFFNFYSTALYFHNYEDSLICANQNFVMTNNFLYYSLSDWTLYLYKVNNINLKFFNYALYMEISDLFSDFFIKSNNFLVYPTLYFYDLNLSFKLDYLPMYNISSSNLNYFARCNLPISKVEPFCWLWNQQFCFLNNEFNILDKNTINFYNYSSFIYNFFSYWFNDYNIMYNHSHLFFFENNVWNISRMVSWNVYDNLNSFSLNQDGYNTYDILFGSENLITIFNNSIFIELNFNSEIFFELLSSQTFVYLLYYFGLKYYFISYLFF